ncbi:hypothetical protein FXW78_34600 [Rhodococcus opacus]|nr:hypothetical protein [Rhodococcus opacus]
MGGSIEAARAAGLNIRRLTFGLFVVGSLLAMLAGLMLAAQTSVATASLGNNIIFHRLRRRGPRRHRPQRGPRHAGGCRTRRTAAEHHPEHPDPVQRAVVLDQRRLRRDHPGSATDRARLGDVLPPPADLVPTSAGGLTDATHHHFGAVTDHTDPPGAAAGTGIHTYPSVASR